MGVAEKNKALVQRFVEVVKNDRKLDAMGEFFRSDYLEHNQTVASFGAKGIEAYQKFLTHFFSGYPDSRVEIQQLIAEGDMVAYRATESGTNKGDFLGIPATNKSASYTEIQFFRIENGEIVEHWVDVDVFTWFQQIGVIPEMG